MGTSGSPSSAAASTLNSERGYMGARKGDPCLTYKEFKESKQTILRGLTLRMVRSRYKYYVISWRKLNGKE